MPDSVLIRDKSKWKDRKMLEEWTMCRVAKTHRNGWNVLVQGVADCIPLCKHSLLLLTDVRFGHVNCSQQKL